MVKRFWVRRGASISLTPDGFLEDPDGEWGRYVNPEARPFTAYAEVPCLVLLSEPGMGKSVEMERIFANRQPPTDVGIFARLGDYDSDEILHREVFSRPEVEALASGATVLTLFLDGLDEGRLAIKNLAQRLSIELGQLGTERLCVRIACRTAEWPQFLEQSLRTLWGDGLVEVLELSPLRRHDASIIASNIVSDANIFLEEISRQRVAPLAAKPITLGLLARTFVANGNAFPATQASLYRAGCELLCEETNQSRLASGATGILNKRERMVVAARLAAVMTFANRAAVWIVPDLGDRPPTDLVPIDIVGGVETIAGTSVQVTSAAVTEALSTGLFSLRSEGRLGWAHQTYAEFLTAWYIHERDLGRPQIDSLFVRYGTGSQAFLVPQLHETAAWLAGVDPAFFRRVIALDPEVLLRSDVEEIGQSERAALLTQLLELAAQDALDYSTYSSADRLAKLDHVALTEQLGDLLSQCNANPEQRELAVAVAGASGHSNLRELVAQVAVDPREAPRVRIAAAYAISRSDDRGAKALLQPLLQVTPAGEPDTDSDDQLRGIALQALWPEQLSAEALFSALSSQKRQDMLGSYQVFVHGLAARVTPDMVLPGLLWVAKEEPSHGFAEDLADEIVWAAWNSIEHDDICAALAPVLLARLEHRDAVVGQKRSQELEADVAANSNRRRLALDVLASALTSADAVYLLTWTPPTFARPEDIPWMLARLSGIDSEVERVWSALICNAFVQGGSNQHFDEIVDCVSSNALLAAAFLPIVNPVEIASPSARQQREHYELRREAEGWRRRSEPPQEQRISYVLERLDAFDTGDMDSFWQIQAEFGLSDDRKRWDNWTAPPDERPLWSRLDESTRSRVVNAAYAYSCARAASNELAGKSKILFPDIAGLNALHLVRRHSFERYSRLQPAVWTAWAPVIIGLPVHGNEHAELEVRDEMLLRAYTASADRVTGTLRALILADDEQHAGVFFDFDRLAGCWAHDANPIARMLLAALQDDALAPNSTYTLLRVLLTHGVAEARERAMAMFEASVNGSVDTHDFAIAAGRALLFAEGRAAWPIVSRLLTERPTVARALVLAVAGDEGTMARLNQELSEDELADFDIWLTFQFPRASDDTDNEGDRTGGWVTASHHVERWRDGILTVLERRGTIASVSAVARIAAAFPEARWLGHYVRSATRVVRRETWQPPSPAEILSLIARRDARLIEDGGQLADVLLESLGRLQHELQGETPSAVLLWERAPKTGNFRPKGEEAFSDEVVRHLRRDLIGRGIFFNREVEIRHPDGIRAGEEVDIRVEVARSGSNGEPSDPVATIIECKGCWHPELMTAMKSQLVERYLAQNSVVTDGIYLVAWYNPRDWDPVDNRVRSVRGLRANIEELRTTLEEQARSLSVDGLRIRAVILDVSLGKKAPRPDPANGSG